MRRWRVVHRALSLSCGFSFSFPNRGPVKEDLKLKVPVPEHPVVSLRQSPLGSRHLGEGLIIASVLSFGHSRLRPRLRPRLRLRVRVRVRVCVRVRSLLLYRRHFDWSHDAVSDAGRGRFDHLLRDLLPRDWWVFETVFPTPQKEQSDSKSRTIMRVSERWRCGLRLCVQARLRISGICFLGRGWVPARTFERRSLRTREVTSWTGL